MDNIFALVDISVEYSKIDGVIDSLSRLGCLEQIYEVTGEYDLKSVVSASGIEEFRDILRNRIMKINGIKGTRIHIMNLGNNLEKLELPAENLGK